MPNIFLYTIAWLGILFFACADQPQDIQFDLPKSEDPPIVVEPEYEEPEIIEETPIPETGVPEMPKTPETTTPTPAAVIPQGNRVINAVIQNELKAKERLTISFPKTELDAPESWTTCKVIDAETEKTLISLTPTSYAMTQAISFQADNERHVHKSFVVRFEYFDADTVLLRSEEVTIFAPITQFAYLWQNREGKPDQGFIVPKIGYVISLSTLNDRTGASDCAMRLVLRVPEGHSVKVSKSVASVASGKKPMTTHFRLSDYNNKYRAVMYPAPDAPLYHYDTDKNKWITEPSLTLDAGFHVVHIVPDSADFDDSELVVMVEHGGDSYGVSMYYVPENIAVLKGLAVSE